MKEFFKKIGRGIVKGAIYLLQSCLQSKSSRKRKYTKKRTDNNLWKS